MIHKEKIGNELYVYINGSLAYKRWIDKGYGMIFCSIFKNYKVNSSDGRATGYGTN